ncbi:MAG: hypothetical protein QE271_08995 [Bacteriovoracaceae bacterium]|nr:hypothetical protein [Bacteriovoracaceae bacterium]
MNFIQHILKNFVFLFLIFYLALSSNIQICYADPVRECYEAICPSLDFKSDLINKSNASTTQIPDLDSPIHQNDLKESLNESLRIKFDINSSDIQSENSYFLVAYWILATGLNDMVFVSHKNNEDTRKFFLDNYR